jgi:hypothetical protein
MLGLLLGRRLLGASRGELVEPGVVHVACVELIEKVIQMLQCIPQCCVFVE